jgi:dolichol-phosphate mannosyltransferase
LKSYDVTLGTRYEKGANVEQGSVSRLKLWGSYILSLATSLFSGQRITDVMCGFKGFKRSVLEELSPRVDHFGYEAELVIKAAKQNYKILNVPITYRKRISGKSNVHLIKHGILVLYTIFKYGLSTKRILQRNNLTLHANKYQRK